MASEVELKFRIPAARLAALRRAVATAGAVVEPLAAAYFDTAGQHLAQARMALRLRREGQQWVQTLKAEGANAMQRLEHNVPVPAPESGTQRPALDIGRHDGSEAGAALRQVLGRAGDAPLAERYATEVLRTRRVLRRPGVLIELALDEGCIRAAGRELPICELEIELLRGTPQALLTLAGRWVDRFGLVLDVRSKSERGQRLGDAADAGLAMSPPAHARTPRLQPDAALPEALAAMQSAALGQVLANASQMAEGPHTPEHLHQLRVGLRRLRSVLAVFGPLVPTGTPMLTPTGDATLTPINGATLASALAALFDQLGSARDQDVMAAWLAPALREAGAPWGDAAAPWPQPVDQPALQDLLCRPATQQLWLAALAACQPPAPARPAAGEAGVDRRADSLRKALRAPLRRLQRQIQAAAKNFQQLDDDALHRLRRRIKRLRYAAEAAQALWPAKPLARTLRRLQQLQAPLGDFNDTVVALAFCRAWAPQDAQAWFAVGWLSARRQALRLPCQQALARFAAQRCCWQRR